MNNEVTAKLLAEFSQQLDRRQPTTAVKAARPSRMSTDGCGEADIPNFNIETRRAPHAAPVSRGARCAATAAFGTL